LYHLSFEQFLLKNAAKLQKKSDMSNSGKQNPQKWGFMRTALRMSKKSSTFAA
jgi:hypothetical protein